PRFTEVSVLQRTKGRTEETAAIHRHGGFDIPRKAKQTTVEQLESLDKDIKELEEFRAKNQPGGMMETETYKNAKLILERFDPEAKKKLSWSHSVRPQMTPRPGQASTQRGGNDTHAGWDPARHDMTPPPGARPPLGPGGTLWVSTPQVLRWHGPILPNYRGAVDRVIEYLVGTDHRTIRTDLQQCFSHNGMALKEEFEYLARKTRPQAPRLQSSALRGGCEQSHAPPVRHHVLGQTQRRVPPTSGDERDGGG
ncbi:hypothetical protein INR49_010378, partial [Caranx melampygus]